MKLILDEAEVKAILLHWAKVNFPEARLTDVDIDCSYSYLRSATFSKKEPQEPQS